MAAKTGGDGGTVVLVLAFCVVLSVFGLGGFGGLDALLHQEPTVDTPVVSEPALPNFQGTGVVLPTLTVAAPENEGSYDRDQFGPAWQDVDRNGCDTRNDILARDLAGETFRDGTHDCVVITGTLNDPYTGTTIGFVKQDASQVQIDHVVPLSYAWQHGASNWSAKERLGFANDPVNLLAVDGPTNGSKSDQGPGEWMPPNQGYWCDYVTRFADVTSQYGLSVSESDWAAMLSVASTC
jgi:hypothetical protein